MAPSLPRTIFDYCVIPEHDNPLPGRGLFITRGVLNPLGSDGEHMEQRILFLIGGPSCHFDWDGEGLARHIRQLVESSPESEFTLTTSRRTPDNFVEQLGGVSANLAVVPWRETGVGWLGEALSRCGSAWVSEDSVSMVYEALTAGVAVGLLPVPMKGDSRVAAGVAGLISEGVVMSFEQWSAGRRLQQPKAHSTRQTGWRPGCPGSFLSGRSEHGDCWKGRHNPLQCAGGYRLCAAGDACLQRGASDHYQSSWRVPAAG